MCQLVILSRMGNVRRVLCREETFVRRVLFGVPTYSDSLGLLVLGIDGRSITAPVQIPGPLAYIELTIHSI